MRARVQVRARTRHRQRVEERVDLLGVEERRTRGVVETEGVDPSAPQFVEARRGPVVAEPLDDRRCGEQRVVRLERRGAVAGGAAHAQPPPGDTLLPHVDADPRLFLRT